MANPIIYPGSSSFTTGSGLTPFGFYENDPSFQQDADRVVSFVALRLGYPILDVELQDKNFYAAFENAITTYGNELYAFKIKDNMLSLEGSDSNIDLNESIITPSFHNIIRLSKQYGTEAGSGGNVTYHTGSIDVIANHQNYDLNQWALDNNISGGIEIKRIFYEQPPVQNRFYDPYATMGLGGVPALGTFGFPSGVSFMMVPVSYDVQLMQNIEFNDTIRRAQHTFELVNNQLRIFPIPNSNSQNHKIYFHYLKIDERLDSQITLTNNKITNESNIPYSNPIYSRINSVGRQWIFEYTLAICKEMLGYIRGKYSNIPIPDSELTLNSGDLITAATKEKQDLIERLRTYFESTSRKSLLENRQMENEYINKTLNEVPLPIYIM
jgi:hypothetical protein